MSSVVLDGRTLRPSDLHRVAHGASAVIPDASRERMARSAAVAVTRGTSLRTKWAWLADREPPADPDALVREFVLAHCAGVGRPLEPALVRAVIAARLNVLAGGHSGVSPAFADAILGLLDADVVPVVPSQGALGAAGSPVLAHILRVACGFGGEAWREGVRMPAEQALKGLVIARPTEKEALSFLNGDTLTSAMLAIAVTRSRRLLDSAIAACALSFEACRVDLDCVDAEASALRGHPGIEVVAGRLRALVDGSALCHVGRRPDPFSLRCAPQVLGAVHDALIGIEDVVFRELNAAVDNPVITDDGAVREVGHFHGAPAALAADHLKNVLVQIASIAERRVFRMTYGQLSGLPSFLVHGTGLNSGLMLAQYTAASLVSEAKGLAHPASVDTIPTVQHREDHVPMGPIAARGALRIAEATADVLAIELLCAAQAVDLRAETVEGAPGNGTAELHGRVRSLVARWHDDQVLHPDLVALGQAVRGGVFTDRRGPW